MEAAMLDQLRELTATASFNQWAGIEVVRVEDGECELRMVWRRDDMGQYAGFLHAGVIAALLDTACGLAATTTSGLSVLSSQFAMHLSRTGGRGGVRGHREGCQSGSQTGLRQR
jgi:uncharacterized protein (TIGR00369 family)